MCEVKFGELPVTPREKDRRDNHEWAVCVANKAAERPGEWCRVLHLEDACVSGSKGDKEFSAKRDALFDLTIRYYYDFEISQKLGVTGRASGELWIREPRGFIQTVKELFVKRN